MHSALHTQEEIQEAYDWREACGKTSSKFPPRNNNHPPEINIEDLPRHLLVMHKCIEFTRDARPAHCGYRSQKHTVWWEGRGSLFLTAG